jgi:hypothetical protein
MKTSKLKIFFILLIIGYSGLDRVHMIMLQKTSKNLKYPYVFCNEYNYQETVQ